MKDNNESRKVGYHYTLKSPQYGNCEVLSPDGQLMFRCCKKKAMWYLDRNLGKKVVEAPLTIQLTFIPKGVGHINDPYFLQKMENRCVVCGSVDDLTRHHIVPYCYRKFFPFDLKNHRSYDVMALCIPCHHNYEEHAVEFKQTLAVKHSAPINVTGIKYNKDLAVAKGAAKAILENRDKIPQQRQEQLLECIKSYLQKDPTDEDLKSLIDKDHQDFSKCVHHGAIVIKQIQDIELFVQEWRKHFIDKMNPQFLPSHWSIYRTASYK
jgi:hypothetical protein